MNRHFIYPLFKKTKDLRLVRLIILVTILYSILVLHTETSGQTSDQIFYSNFSIPMITASTEHNHYVRGNMEDVTKDNPPSSTKFRIWIKNAKINISNSGFYGRYENDGEVITFAGTFSSDRTKLQWLRISYNYLKESSYQTQKVSGQFNLYDLAIIKNVNRYNCLFEKGKSTVFVEAYNSSLVTNTSYQITTLEERLIDQDEEYFNRIRLFWNIFFISSGDVDNQTIAIRGNSTTYAGYVIAGLATHPDITLFDFTDEATKARAFEASLKDICHPVQRHFAVQTEETLNHPQSCKTTVTINETHDTANETIDTKVVIQGQKGKKELHYHLSFGGTEAELIKCNQQLLSNTDEIVANILSQ